MCGLHRKGKENVELSIVTIGPVIMVNKKFSLKQFGCVEC